MAVLPNQFTLFGVQVTLGRVRDMGESRRAREFANRVYRETRGPTPELRRLYDRLLEHERRSSGS